MKAGKECIIPAFFHTQPQIFYLPFSPFEVENSRLHPRNLLNMRYHYHRVRILSWCLFFPSPGAREIEGQIETLRKRLEISSSSSSQQLGPKSGDEEPCVTSVVEDITTVHVMVTGYNGRGHVLKLPLPREDEVRDPISLPHQIFETYF